MCHVQAAVHVAYASSCAGLFGGGAAEYSGGVTLAAATAKACHIACQVQPQNASSAGKAAPACVLCRKNLSQRTSA